MVAKTSLDEVRRVPELTRTAYHEAGHAVLSAAINDKPVHVSIRPETGTLGRTRQRHSARPTSMIQVHLAGYAAEHLLTNRRSPTLVRQVQFAILSRDDKKLRAAFLDTEGCDGRRAVDGVFQLAVFESDQEVEKEVDRFYDISRESLSSVWVAVRSVAEALLQHQELDRDGLDDALGDVDIHTPVFAVQRKHGLLLQPASATSARSTTEHAGKAR